MTARAERADPELWEQVKREVMHGDKGGHADQWSARKAQLAVQEYKKRGGGYKGKRSADNHLLQWEREDWGTKSGGKSADTGERYLPREAREGLSAREYARTTAKKRRDASAGRQFSAQPEDVARKTVPFRESGKNGAGTRPAKRGRVPAAGTFSVEDRRAVAQEFRKAVNMPPARLRAWLQGSPSRSVGMRKGGEKVTGPAQGEAVGHAMGRRIVLMKGKRQADLTDEDIRAMRKVIGYVHRHLKQRPDGDVTDTRWRRSLMNWGHDPLL